MSDEIQQIKEELDLFARKRGPAALIAVKVLSVNESECTVEVEFDGGAKIDDVQLRSVVKTGNKVVLLPKVNSIVLISSINKSNEYYVVAVEEVTGIINLIDDVSVKVTGTDVTTEIKTVKYTIDQDGFLLKKGTETMKKIMDDLLQGIQVLTVNTNVGPSSVPINVATFAAIKVRVDNFFK